VNRELFAKEIGGDVGFGVSKWRGSLAATGINAIGLIGLCFDRVKNLVCLFISDDAEFVQAFDQRFDSKQRRTAGIFTNHRITFRGVGWTSTMAAGRVLHNPPQSRAMVPA
jgi:hypothetical protein